MAPDAATGATGTGGAALISVSGEGVGGGGVGCCFVGGPSRTSEGGGGVALTSVGGAGVGAILVASGLVALAAVSGWPSSRRPNSCGVSTGPGMDTAACPSAPSAPSKASIIRIADE